MSIENITLFSELHAEPSWLQDLRKKSFLTRSISWNCQPLNASNFTAGILGMGRSQKARLLPMFPILQPSIQT